MDATGRGNRRPCGRLVQDGRDDHDVHRQAGRGGRLGRRLLPLDVAHPRKEERGERDDGTADAGADQGQAGADKTIDKVFPLGYSICR